MHKMLKMVLVPLLAAALGLALQTDSALAHYCDDHYDGQQAREDCWWRYWNQQPSPQDRQYQEAALAATTPAPNGAYCDAHYTEQQARENCWWRYHNGLPLLESPSDSPSVSQGDTVASFSARSSSVSQAPLPHASIDENTSGSDYMNSITVDCGAAVDAYKRAGWECEFDRFGAWHAHDDLPGHHRHALFDGETLGSHSH